MGNLANTHSALGEHQKAKELNTTVLEKQKQVLGNNHPDTLFTMGNLANTLSPGRASKGQRTQLTVLEKQKQVLGDHHPHTLIIMGNLASIYSNLGEHQRPKNSTLLCWRNRNNSRHPAHHGQSGQHILSLGQHQKAKELKATVLEKQSQFLLPTHSPSLHVSPPPPFPLQPSHAPSSLPPLSKLGRWLKKRKQTASAAAEPASAGEIKATRKHALQDNTRPH
ncbi:hypothetical protein B0H14DRAFT_3013094 [Mycena olivaceomarginata]|nr:hypothetical protein B0H14DRAFT_3013094 [Mycena olivaceomarginata]